MSAEDLNISLAEESIGEEKFDNVPAGVVPDKRYFTTAAQLKKIKAALIELCSRSIEGSTGSRQVRLAKTTNHGLSGLAAIDGVTPSIGDRVLLVGQTAHAENGPWIAASGAWARATDALEIGTLFIVTAGTAGAGALYWLATATADPIVPGTTQIEFEFALSAAAVLAILAAAPDVTIGDGTGSVTIFGDGDDSIHLSGGRLSLESGLGVSGGPITAESIEVANDAAVGGSLTVDSDIAADTASITGLGFGRLFPAQLNPAQITSDQTSYGPTGFTTATHFTVTTDATRAIRSMATTGTGTWKAFRNGGSFKLVFKHEYTSGTAAGERFNLPRGRDFVLLPGCSCIFMLDATQNRWTLNGPSEISDPRWTTIERQDFIGPTAAIMYLSDSLNTGAVAIATAAGAGGGLIAGHPGILQLTTSTNAGGVGCAFALGSVGQANWGPQLGGSEVRLFHIFKIDALSTVGEEFIFGIGSANNRALSAGGATGMWIEYDRLTSANWRYKTGTGGSGAAAAGTSSVAVTTGWHYCEIVVDEAAGSVEYFVDGVSLGTLTTGIPNGNWLTAMATIVKSAGTTARTVLWDYTHCEEIFAVARA